MRKRRGEKIMWMLKSLLASYIVTGLLLLGLTFLVYKFELDEQVVVAGIVAIYVVSTFMGGYIIGKLTGTKKSETITKSILLQLSFPRYIS